MSLETTDAECAAVATAPRVSLSTIEDTIQGRFEFPASKVLDDNPNVPLAMRENLKLLSICILIMRNGFMVIGKSAPASPENHNSDLGRKLAYEDAVRQLWPLMGYALRERLHGLSA